MLSETVHDFRCHNCYTPLSEKVSSVGLKKCWQCGTMHKIVYQEATRNYRVSMVGPRQGTPKELKQDKDKKGFSGLSDLASEVGGVDDAVHSEAISETKPSQGIQGQEGTPRSSPERKPTSSRPPIKTVNTGKSVGGSGWKWILGLVGVLVVIWIANNGGNTPSPTHNTYKSPPSRSTLAQEIETAKLIAEQLEVQIRDMDRRLEDYELRMTTYRASGMTDEHNMLVPSFNSLVGKRNNLYKEYRSLIDEVNSKVRRYNSRNR